MRRSAEAQARTRSVLSRAGTTPDVAAADVPAGGDGGAVRRPEHAAGALGDARAGRRGAWPAMRRRRRVACGGRRAGAAAARPATPGSAAATTDDAAIEAAIAERLAARKARDFARADAIRRAILRRGASCWRTDRRATARLGVGGSRTLRSNRTAEGDMTRSAWRSDDRPRRRRRSVPIGNSPVVILVRPQLADNIGACARAMANGGLFHLRLVAPRDGWPQEKAWRTASGADRILDAATVHRNGGRRGSRPAPRLRHLPAAAPHRQAGADRARRRGRTARDRRPRSARRPAVRPGARRSGQRRHGRTPTRWCAIRSIPRSCR